MTKQVLSLGIALLIVPTVLLGWSIIAHNVRIWRVRAIARGLPPGVRQRILTRIATAARGASACTLLVPIRGANPIRDELADSTANGAIAVETNAVNQPNITASCFGGTPYGEAGEQWPALEEGSSVKAEFLMQARLDDSLPAPWPGRLVVVFLKFDAEQTVFVYADPAPDKYVRRPDSLDPSPPQPLQPIPIPVANQPITEPPLAAEHSSSPLTAAPAVVGFEWQLPYDPSLLIEIVPGLDAELRAFTRRPADLLVQLIAPEIYGYDLDLSDLVQLGGQPQWVQDDPGPFSCTTCGQPMRFLFQFGDLSGRNRLGDAGVCFVFGCDAHPDHVQSTVQMC